MSRALRPPASIAHDTIARNLWTDLAQLLLAEKRFGPRSRVLLEECCRAYSAGAPFWWTGGEAAYQRFVKADRVVLRCLTKLALTPRSRTQRLERIQRARDAVALNAQRIRRARGAIRAAKRKGTVAAARKAEAAYDRAVNAHARAQARLAALLQRDAA